MNIETTADGSPTLYVPELDEHYHSTKGALTESRHIFIEMGLRQSTAPCPHVLEVGFGTGLNAFLTLLDADKSRRPVCYTGIELHPVQTTTLRALDYPALICPRRTDDFYRLHEAPWETDVALTPHFTLRKVQADFTTWTPDETYDVVYFDAFAPEKQPSMWAGPLFDRLYASLSEGGILTTYCAKGIVRRMLQSAGFHVERLPGPPGGKREILRAVKVG